MSQLIKKLKATQTQNTFVTPEAAAKIISSSVRKSKRKYFTLWTTMIVVIMGIIGTCFFIFEDKKIQKSTKVDFPIESGIKIAVTPLNFASETSLELEDSYEESVDPVPAYENLYEQGARLYIKDCPEFIPSVGLLLSKYLNPYLQNCMQIAQQLKKVKKSHIVHKKSPSKPTTNLISLKDAIPVVKPIQMSQKKLFQDKNNEQDDFIITAPRLTEEQQQHLDGIHNLLNHMQIESVREEGSQSRLKANGHIYHLNALVSMKPRLTWMGIQHNELIFYDEYKQEYRKKIAQN